MSDEIDKVRSLLESTPEPNVVPLERARSKRSETPGEIFDPQESSWIPTTLTTQYVEEAPPSILRMMNGRALLYPGRDHLIFGESSSGKSWLAVFACAEVLASGGKVLWIDYESNPNELIGRFISMSVPSEDYSRVSYIRPEHALWDRNTNAGSIHSVNLLENAERERYDLVIIDALTGALSLEGFDPNAGTDIETMYNILPRKFTRLGASVLMIDHVGKNDSKSTRYSIGSERKLAGLSGVSYHLTVTEPWKRATMTPLTGSFDLMVAKDRSGQVGAPEEKVTTGVVTSDPDGGLRIKLSSPSDTIVVPSMKRITEILDHLKTYPGASKSDIETTLGGNSGQIRHALKYLTEVGAITVERSGNSYRHNRNEQKIRELDY